MTPGFQRVSVLFFEKFGLDWGGRRSIVARYWLLDRHNGEGPTALVETDGRMQVVRVLRFGPGITELDDQQAVWDQVIGRVVPTLKPFVEATSIDEEGFAPHSNLWRSDGGGAGATNRAGRGDRGGPGSGVGRAVGGLNSKRNRGDR